MIPERRFAQLGHTHNDKLNTSGDNSNLVILRFFGGASIVYNQDWKIIEFQYPDGTTLQNGGELWFIGKCSGTINNGDCVQFVETVGTHYIVKKAVPAELNANPLLFMGIATTSGLNNDFIKVTWFGEVNGIDTSMYSLPADAILYVNTTSPTNGLTSTKPTPPNAIIQACALLQVSATQGRLLVRPTFQNVLISDVTGLQDALDGKVSKSGDTITGTLNLDGIVNQTYGSALKQTNVGSLYTGNTTNVGVVVINLGTRNFMFDAEISVYSYSYRGKIKVSGYTYVGGTGWYAPVASGNFDVISGGTLPINVRFSSDGINGNRYIMIGDTTTDWNAYLHVVVDEINSGFGSGITSPLGITLGTAYSGAITFAYPLGVVWTSSNDGTGSGLDADLLDGQQATYFQQALVSGTNIKTVNGNSLLGSGNLAISAIVNGLPNVGYGNGDTGTMITGYQDSGNLQTWTGGWASHLILNHGDGATYFNNIMTFPFWGPPTYMRKEAGVNKGSWTFWTTENDSSLAKVSNVYDDSATYRQYMAKGGSSTGYMRTPSEGLLPSVSSASGSGYVGTPAWPFQYVYAKNIYQNDQAVLSIAGQETTNPRTLKMSDGTIIKWGTVSSTVAITTAQGSMYYSGSITITFDTSFPFTVAPVLSVYVLNTSELIMSTLYAVTTTSASFRFVAPRSVASATQTIHYMAIGR